MLALLGEPVCLGCARPWQSASFCAACQSALVRGGVRGDLMCGFLYTGPLQRAILRWKEHGKEQHGGPLGGLFAARAKMLVATPLDFIVPVPPAFWRTLRRGFHPPDVLAQAAARALGVEVLKRALVRTDSARQMGRDRRSRARALIDKGRAIDRVTGKHVLVVDDVMTTGATARAAMSVIAAARPASVRFLALAAVP
ncbi:MAG: ComF family protein [Deltaproteobacteria bacterium]|nr:ComF family protein [Deltaproteobacteria bacterium]